jgi:TonB family protein
MTSFINYLVESGISLSLFAVVYFLFLRKETFFNINRWFLLVSVVFSAVLPLLHIPFYAAKPVMLDEVTVTPYVNLLSTITVYGTDITTGAEQFVLSYSILGYVYLVGVVFFAIKLLVQLGMIARLIVSNEVIADGKNKLVVLDREMSPFSFLNYIFVGRNLHETKGWEKMIEHEQQHITQGHTVDVLVLEVVAVVQWFNPFFWMFRRALRENHEFLADQAVIAHGTAPSWYKQILINQYVGDQIVIANNFNYSLIKTRIKMLSKIKSGKITYAKILLGVLLAGSLTASFAFEPKNMESLPQTPKSQAKTIVVDGKSVQLSGDAASVEKILKAISESEDFYLKEDKSTGQAILSPRTKEATKHVSKKGNEPNADGVYNVVDEMPQFPGGLAALRQFLAENVKYPDSAVKNKIQGKVYVNFVVSKDGTVSRVKIVRGVDPALDAEALRVVSLLPKWGPGIEKGKAVDVFFTVPINFALQ